MKLFTKESLEKLEFEMDIMKVIRLYFSPDEIYEDERFSFMSCPFHENNDCDYPFIIRGNKYYCFECDAKGDAITLLMNYKGWTYDETFEFLCRLFSVKPERC